MADLTIKPQAGTGNKLIIQDQAGNARVTTSDAGIDIPAVSGNFAAAGNLTVSGDFVPSAALSNRNMIINGGMLVWQRTTAATAASGYDTVDRWKMNENSDGAMTSQQHDMSLAELNTTGHKTALRLDVTTADTSIAASQYVYFHQRIEARNLQHLQYGTANAKTITLSFWVKSNKTGIYVIHIKKADTTQYICPIEYTISSADTWEQKKITLTPTAGSTSLITGAGGIILNDKNEGFQVGFGLAWGSNYHGTNNTWADTTTLFATSNQVNWMDSTSNNFYITGIQLEVGSNATPFEHRTYQEDHIKCCRYYQILQGLGGMCAPALQNSSTNYAFTLPLVTPLRSSPTLTRTGNLTMCRHNGYETLTADSNVYWRSDPIQPSVDFAGAGLSQGSDMYGGMMYCGTTKFELYAEL